jgi:sugar lactone lactonase YvrE
VLLRVDPDGSVTQVAEDMWFPNGSVLTDDGVLLVDETFGNRITAFDVDAEGTLTNRRVWASFGDLPTERDLQAALGQLVVGPDGCGLDAEGALWIADALGNRVLRIREGGEIAEEVPVGTGVFACMLGGQDGRTLFLCAAPDFDREARSAAREAQLLSCHVDVPHAGLP